MEPTTDNNRTYQLVDGDKDVLLIEEDSFIVSKFKELIRRDIAGKFYIGNQGNQTRLNASFIKISLGQKRLDLDHINWLSIQDGELLKTGSKGWEKGKFRIQCVIKITPITDDQGRIEYNTAVQVDIEFSPDESPQPESPLDDLRQLPEYKQQL